MNKYATDCMELDRTRRDIGERAESLRRGLAYLDRRLKLMSVHPLSDEAQEAIGEQREKVLMVHDILVDFGAYLDTAEAWAPALPEPPEPDGFGFDLVARASAAMDELLKKL